VGRCVIQHNRRTTAVDVCRTLATRLRLRHVFLFQAGS
jgi:hypothetical protein